MPKKLKFGSNSTEDIRFKELAQKTGQYTKQQWGKAKQWFQRKTNKTNPEKKAAMIGAGVGAAAGTAAEILTGGLTMGSAATVVGTAAATAATSYYVKKQKAEREAPSQDHLPLSESASSHSR